ncbi:MAG: hypothetical protein ACFFA4_02435 [Promethearchaeota archaeon]
MLERAEEIYQALLDGGISEEELIQQIKEKTNEFQGFMTKQAILYLIAKENGINVDSSDNVEMVNHITEDIIDYNEFSVPISSIVENINNIVIAGRVERIYTIRDFIKKDGTPGRIGSFQICDASECIKIILWNENVEIMENDLFKKGEIIQLVGGYSKKNSDGKLEVHLSRQGTIILAPETVLISENLKPNFVKNKSIEISDNTKQENLDIKSQLSIQNLHNKDGYIRFISGIVNVEFFKEFSLKNGEKSFLLKLQLSDGSASIKVNIWGLKAVECIKLITNGDKVKFFNVVIKENSYTNDKELNFTRNSTLSVL